MEAGALWSKNHECCEVSSSLGAAGGGGYVPFPVASAAPKDGSDFRRGWGQGGKGKGVSDADSSLPRQQGSFIICRLNEGNGFKPR